jgi:hypothetical protein
MIITRYPYQVDDILHSEQLNCHPAESQAAKIFVKWLKEHPEYNETDVDMRIVAREREEDYHGNGGGYDYCMQIYKRREETKEECQARINREEDEKFDDFNKHVRRSVSDLIRELNLYPNLVSDEITAKTDEIVNAIIKDARQCLKAKMQESRKYEE